MGLGRVAVAEEVLRSPAGSAGARSRSPGATPLPVPNAGADEVERRRVVEVAGDRHDDVRRPIGRRPELADRRPRQGPDALLVAADLAAEGAIAEHRLLDQDLGVLGRVVEVGADLLDDDRPLVVDLVVLETRPDDELGDDVGRPLAPRGAGTRTQ